ncbi:MAG: carbon starvation CstA family protein [Bacteroidales bacterium]
MITFLICLAILIAGYFFYGKYVDRIFGTDAGKTTPAYEVNDGVDYIPMSDKRIFLIQFLNIAGLGPIYGAIMGAMYGPVVFLWITFGTIFAGAVHDYFSGMISLRNNGKSLPEIIGDQLGLSVRQVIRVFTLILMILVGAVFVSGPADILTGMSDNSQSLGIWTAIIFVYYMMATLFPIDKIIGKIYPVFGLALFIMAFGIMGAMLMHGYEIPDLTSATFTNMNPNSGSFPIFPFLFVTVACGAISGFHATQSPLMARCLKKETEGRKVFFGAMVAEGIIALIWAAAAMSFFGNIGSFQDYMLANSDKAALVVESISVGWLGKAGKVLVLLGVVAAPITSGDTAFRSARLIIADVFNFSQKSIKNRLMIAIPLFAVAFILLQVNFGIIWRYFAWCNQTLAVFTLWAITIYLVRLRKNYFITLIPALFMTAVSSSYILMAKEGFNLNHTFSYSLSLAITLAVFVLFIIRKKNIESEPSKVKVRS